MPATIESYLIALHIRQLFTDHGTIQGAREVGRKCGRKVYLAMASSSP